MAAPMIQGPVTLLILDGFGDGPRNAFDATFVAAMPRFNALRKTYATTQLITGGEAVGLPEGQFGNSEVGHMNLGAGRVVWQELTRIDAAIRKGTFRENTAIGALLGELKASGKRLHLWAWSPTAASTATRTTSSPWPSGPRPRASPPPSTPSWTAATPSRRAPTATSSG